MSLEHPPAVGRIAQSDRALPAPWDATRLIAALSEDDGNVQAGDGCSPACAFESTDADNDGLSNAEEQILGTDPLDPLSFPAGVPALGALGLAAASLLLLGAGYAVTTHRSRIS